MANGFKIRVSPGEEKIRPKELYPGTAIDVFDRDKSGKSNIIAGFQVLDFMIFCISQTFLSKAKLRVVVI